MTKDRKISIMKRFFKIKKEYEYKNSKIYKVVCKNNCGFRDYHWVADVFWIWRFVSIHRSKLWFFG